MKCYELQGPGGVDAPSAEQVMAASRDAGDDDVIDDDLDDASDAGEPDEADADALSDAPVSDTSV